MADVKFLKCKFIARLDDQTHHDLYVMVQIGTPYDYIWELAIRECNKFKSPLQQLSFVEEVTVRCSTATEYNDILRAIDKED